jgi:2-oxoglutarate ferredoxin oxidoreductase subunit alpha
MKADKKAILTGPHFIDGNHAACEGAIAAGCRFVAGYPITPSTEVVERFAMRIPRIGGVFIQMEDEIASSIAITGAVWGGKKAMTVTSGPGFSLMMEHLGYAAITETPLVFIDVQRGGPSTGLPTLPAQGDMMQARWGSHGDYEIIALSPNSPQECFDLIIKAFNLSEKYRVPVLFMMDECVGHMTEKVVIPEADKIEVTPRRYTKLKPEDYLPFKPGKDLVPEMIKAGDGYNVHITGLTHNYKGYPVMNADCQKEMVGRLIDKIRKHANDIIDYREDGVDDAEVVVLSFGITTRIVIQAVEMARKKGLKVGSLRLVVVWPFPEKRVLEISKKAKALVMVEMNMGQMYHEMDRCAKGGAKTYLVPHAGGTVHNPKDILKVIEEAVK